MADIDIATLTPFQRGAILGGYVLIFQDGTPDVLGLALVDDIAAGVAGAEAENEAGATYTLVIEDAFKYKRLTNGAGCAVTVPLNANVPFALGDLVTLRGVAAGCTLVPEGAVVLNIPGGGAQPYSFQEAHATTQLKKVGTDEWDVIGGIEGTI